MDQRSDERFVEGATMCFENGQRGNAKFEVFGLQSRKGAQRQAAGRSLRR